MAITITVTDGAETVISSVSNANALRIVNLMQKDNLSQNPNESNMAWFVRWWRWKVSELIKDREQIDAYNSVEADPDIIAPA